MVVYRNTRSKISSAHFHEMYVLCKFVHTYNVHVSHVCMYLVNSTVCLPDFTIAHIYAPLSIWNRIHAYLRLYDVCMHECIHTLCGCMNAPTRVCEYMCMWMHVNPRTKSKKFPLHGFHNKEYGLRMIYTTFLIWSHSCVKIVKNSVFWVTA